MWTRNESTLFVGGVVVFAFFAGCRSPQPITQADAEGPVPGLATRRNVVPAIVAVKDVEQRRQRRLARYGLQADWMKNAPDDPQQGNRRKLAAKDKPGSQILKASHRFAQVVPKSASEPNRLQATTVPPAPTGTQESVQPMVPTVPAAEGTHEIDLSTSLALVAGQNPQVGFVQQRVAEACAILDRAESLWLPSVRIGANYNKHEGSFQDVAGTVSNVSRGSLYTGFGARAVGASSPAVPGLSAQFHVADAIFQPLIARRTVSARQYAVAATTNDLLLQAAVGYFDLAEAVEQNRVARETLNDVKKLADLTASFAKRGQGTQADADRTRTELELQKNRVTRSVEAVQKASSRLAEVLGLEHDMELRPTQSTDIPVVLVDGAADLKSLIDSAVTRRPEMSRNLMEISAASNRYEKERFSPFIPHVGAGMSWGGFGGGVGDTITHYRDRFDVDAWVFWEVRNLGIGERAARNAAGARVHQAQFQRARIANRIRREVKDGSAELLSTTKQVKQAEAGVKAAKESYRKNDQRIRNGQGLPIEVLQSIRALDAAKREQVRARAAYNRAQFRLHHAIGWPTNP